MKRVNVINAIALLVALPALSYSLYVGSPVHVAQSAQRLMADAAVSMSASIAPNPYNTEAEQLAAKEARLNERAAQLTAQQNDLSSQGVIRENLGLISFFISLLLLVLVGLNFYFDRRRAMPLTRRSQKFLVDLR
jgi:hypothetical protein